MPWCPKCKYEYRKEFKSCSDCGCALVEFLEPEKEENIEKGNEMIENDTEAFLISVGSDYDAKIFESKLSAFGIPSFRRFIGIDGIYGFANSLGIEIYVPSRLLEQAKRIINQ